MSSLATHLARRGLQLTHGAVAGDDQPKIQLSPVAILVLSVTCLLFFALFAAVSIHSPGWDVVVPLWLSGRRSVLVSKLMQGRPLLLPVCH
jgi:hypothetical protein